MRFMNRSILMSVALSLPLVATSAFADPVVINGGFEAGTVEFAKYSLGTPIAGWTSTGNLDNTGVDSLMGPDFLNAANNVGLMPHSGNNAALLGPDSVNGSGMLSQTITDHAGDTDQLVFWLASECFSGPSCNDNGANGKNKTKNTFSYSIGGSSSGLLSNIAETGTDGTNGIYVPYTLSFLATGSDTITFNFTNDDDYFGLDDVSVSVLTPAVSTTPEPSSLVLLGTGVLGFAGAARRKFLNA